LHQRIGLTRRRLIGCLVRCRTDRREATILRFTGESKSDQLKRAEAERKASFTMITLRQRVKFR
jgi:hypothetical protein